MRIFKSGHYNQNGPFDFHKKAKDDKEKKQRTIK